MRVIVELQTIRTAFRQICEGQTPWVPLGNFTNDFFDFVNLREGLIAESIEGLMESSMESSYDLHQWAVFCAASVEYLCSMYDLPCPAWVCGYTALSQPWFFSPAAQKNSRVRERYERETPEVFARYNIFCGNRVFLDKRGEAEALRLKLSA